MELGSLKLVPIEPPPPRALLSSVLRQCRYHTRNMMHAKVRLRQMGVFMLAVLPVISAQGMKYAKYAH